MVNGMSSKERKYATANHPTLEALVHGLYRYKDRAQAVARLKNIAEHFVLSKEQPESSEENPAIMLWIKGFGVTEDETAKGFTGHFAEVRIAAMDNGVFTLAATRVEKPLSSHPQKKRLQSKHPNWGHPVMRAIKKGRVYTTIEEASSELEQLHLEFPEVSIPGQGKLFIIIYEKREGIARPTHKIALELQATKEGGFIITARDNEKADKPKIKPQHAEPGADTAKPKEGGGYFTAMVAVKKKRRTKNAGRPVTGMKPEGDA